MAFGFVSTFRLQQAIVFDADALQKIELSFKEGDVAFFVFEKLFKDLHGDVITVFAADITRFRIAFVREVFTPQVAFQNFLDVLSDHE